MNIEELVNNYAEKKAEFAKIKRETEELNHKIIHIYSYFEALPYKT